MFARIFLSASIAGIAAALALTLAQALWVTPLILQAEELEDAAPLVHEHHHEDAAEHHHDHAWQPENGWERTLWTAASNGVMGIGYALLLCGMYALRRAPSVAQGLAFGLAGYVAFFAAPAIGLPPELPGSASAELALRQAWWLCTAASTAAGLALMFLQPRHALRALGALLLATPHLVGAPHPALSASLAAQELQTQFLWGTALVNALFWALLGLLSAAAFRRLAAQPLPA